MEANDCNCYAAPCGDICSTRRMNEQQVTMCLNHALNNEEGIPSACEYDLAALISMVMLQSIGRRPSYMGNTYAIPRQKDGKHIPFPKMPFFDKEETARQLAKLENVDNLVLTFHSVPNRRWTSYDAPVRPYAIGPFTHSGWGATIRYDFAADEGQVVTMCRVDPTCKKILIAKGTIVGGLGFGQLLRGRIFRGQRRAYVLEVSNGLRQPCSADLRRFRRSARSAGGKLGLGSSARIVTRMGAE